MGGSWKARHWHGNYSPDVPFWESSLIIGMKMPKRLGYLWFPGYCAIYGRFLLFPKDRLFGNPYVNQTIQKISF